MLSAMLLALVGASPAHAADIVFSTGPDRGSYDLIGERLKTELIVRQGLRIELRNSSGSVANLKLLDDPTSPVNLALAQADVLGLYATENPEFVERTVQLGDVGKECAFLIGAAANEADSLTALQRRGGRISVGEDNGGAKVTFSSMLRIQPALGRLRPVLMPTLEALLQLRQPAAADRPVAVLLVQRPRRVSPAIQEVLRHPNDYRWIPIRESEVGNASLPDGTPLYSFGEVQVGGVRGGGLRLETLCTRGLLLAAKQKLSFEQRELLSRVLLEAGPAIIGRTE